MPPPQQGQQQAQGIAMPPVNSNMLVADDYVYEPVALPEKEDNSQQTASGGMASQFEIVSSPLNKNI